MSNLDPFEHVPAGLGPVLKARGFNKLAAIQEAVLADGLHGRDLRLCSQTGSGKTVAIGLALATDLVANGTQEPRPKGKAVPQVVLIAPTRELAAQLGNELTWLYRPLGKTITVVTGGTNLGLDFRALKGNPDILVGTPGRLLDHVQRGSVDLRELQAVVLDEADEMLDMGFRNELEAILQVTPKDRRTHMVSATFARDVLGLAKRYQQNAVSVQGSNPKEANTDITHIAHELSLASRLDALINILLADPDQRTLVFVRTRIATVSVATELTASGFKAFPLNGEMSQRERTATLDAFRYNKVQLLIATDVAARGLDIRDVHRIVHFDLPENPETFTHRSGRTGRAGAKGTSILFAPPNARRKTEYLTRAAKAKLEWRPLPSVNDILKAAELRLIESLMDPTTGANAIDSESNTRADAEQSANSPTTNHSQRLQQLAKTLLDGRDAQQLVASLLSRMNISGPCEPRHIKSPTRSARQQSHREPRPGHSRSSRQRGHRAGNQPNHRAEDYSSFQVTWGANQGADPRRMLALVCRRGNVRSQSIGAIRISDNGAVVEVRTQDASAFAKAAGRPDHRDPRIKIRPWLEPQMRGGGPKAKPRKSYGKGRHSAQGNVDLVSSAHKAHKTA